MLRVCLYIFAFACACVTLGQQPQVSVNLDLWPMARADRDGKFRFHWYDDVGHHSVVSVTMLTEVGFRAFVSQRLELISGDADNEYLNEFYIEDTGYWRVGKQQLPFGLESLERELVTAARADTRFALGGWPLKIAWCGGNVGLPTGYVARVGRAFGLSIASGRHFGVSGLAFQEVRRPEDSPGRGRGYREMYGADFTQRLGSLRFECEWVRTRRGHSEEDVDNDFGLARLVYVLNGERSLALTLVRDFDAGLDYYRLRHSLLVHERLETYQQVRWRKGSVNEASIGLRVRF
ncbi:MAG: hypothetical protein HRF45_03405 [Fimbriimonadia bacterium]